jgi:hypothetical protein
MQNRYGNNGSCTLPGILHALVLCILFFGVSPAAYTQELSKLITDEADLPDAPSFASSPQSSNRQSTATISGYVTDVNGGIVPTARITLQSQEGLPDRTEPADATGFFSFNNLPAGTFKIKVTATDLQPYESFEIPLRAGENRQLPIIALPIATSNVTVQVVVTQEQVANEQVTAQIQQRVFGIFPNFYTSFVWDAAPLNPKQKFRLAFRSATDPVTFFTTGFLAGIQQARDTYPDYGQGAEGYAKRYGADYADIFVGRMLGAAVLPSILHQDPRYFYQGSGSFGSRTWHALSSAFICRGDNGKRQFNFSHILGNFAAGSISNLYRPDNDRGIVLAIDNALLHTAANAAGNLAREFALKNITTKVTSNGKAKQKPTVESPNP